MATKKVPGSDRQAVGFEQALQRLEAIVREMEQGSLSLDTMIQRFEEGQALIRVCSGKLNEVERKIEMLVKKDGETEVVPFEAEEQGDGDRDGAADRSAGGDKKGDDGSVPF